MAVKAIFKVEGVKYNLLECEYEFIQPIKENGQPAGRSSGSLIHCTFVSPDNSDLFLHDWMQNSMEQKDGQIVFSVVDAAKPSDKTLHFKHAYCVRLYEYFNSHSDSQMLTKITISAAEISFGNSGNVVFKNDQK